MNSSPKDNFLHKSAKFLASGNLLYWTLSIALLVSVIALLVPLMPAMPVITDSEKFAVNYATAHGFIIGKDIIYTSGPYASVYSGQYGPSTDLLMLVGSIYLSITTWLALAFLAKGVAWRWMILLFLVFSGLIYFKDAFMLFIPLCSGLVIFKALTSKEHGAALIQSKFAPLYVALLFSSFGLLPLTKGTLLVTCLAICIYCTIALFINHYKKLATICLISPILSMLLFWVIAGQSLENLPIYFSSMQSTISGYSNAMSVVGQPVEVIRYLISALLLFASIYFQKDLKQKILLIGLYFIFLFISFKGGFVRHDSHAVLAATSLLIATVLLPFMGIRSKLFIFTLIFSISTVAYINGNYIRTTPESFLQNVKTLYQNTFNGLIQRLTHTGHLEKQYTEALNTIHQQMPFPSLKGTSDIYSHDQAYLLASSNTWSPRPAFQSYTAYTPKLENINRLHLESPQAPDNIFISLEPVDQRLPSSEDGSSWPLLLSRYTPVDFINHYLLLKKKDETAPIKIQWDEQESHRLGENVALPNTTKHRYIRIFFKPTLLGRLKNVLFKSNLVFINLEMVDGRKKQFRLVPGMTENGILISPLIENTNDFYRLYSAGSTLDKSRVKSFSITERPSLSSDWESEYIVQLSN